MSRKPLILIDGYSESIWKSLVVKSLRIGWPTGIEEAAKHLPLETVDALLVCGIFEDIFPPKAEVSDCLSEIRSRNYDALCSCETHHGRGLIEAFCRLEVEACAAAISNREHLLAQASSLDVPLAPRALNCFYAWLKLKPQDVNARRSLDDARWMGVPKAIGDCHTYEGKILRTLETVLSGTYENHAVLGKRVMSEGWAVVRTDFHAEFLFFALKNHRWTQEVLDGCSRTRGGTAPLRTLQGR